MQGRSLPQLIETLQGALEEGERKVNYLLRRRWWGLNAWNNQHHSDQGRTQPKIYICIFFCTSWWKCKNILTVQCSVYNRHSKALALAMRNDLAYLFVGRGKRHVLFLEQSTSTKQKPWYLEEAVRNKAVKMSWSYTTGIFHSKECIKIHLILLMGLGNGFR